MTVGGGITHIGFMRSCRSGDGFANRVVNDEHMSAAKGRDKACVRRTTIFRRF